MSFYLMLCLLINLFCIHLQKDQHEHFPDYHQLTPENFRICCCPGLQQIFSNRVLQVRVMRKYLGNFIVVLIHSTPPEMSLELQLN